MKRQNEIAFVCGRKGTGKSTLLYRYFVTHCARVISIDFVGEVQERNPNAILAVGYEQVLAVVYEMVRERRSKWHIAAVFDQYNLSDLPKLFRLLAPPFHPEHPGLSKSLQGIGLECSEADLIWPNMGATPEAKNVLQRGRHENLSVFMATQRPASCNRLCTSLADHVISFRMHEPRDMKFLAETVSREFADRVRNLGKYESLWFLAEDGRVVYRDRNGKVLAESTLNEQGSLFNK